jgi:hypothetical protein
VDVIVKTMARLEVHGWRVHICWSVSSITLGLFDQGPTGPQAVMRVWWKRHANFTAEKCALARYWSAGLILGLERSIHRLVPLHDYNIEDAFQLHLGKFLFFLVELFVSERSELTKKVSS